MTIVTGPDGERSGAQNAAVERHDAEKDIVLVHRLNDPIHFPPAPKRFTMQTFSLRSLPAMLLCALFVVVPVAAQPQGAAPTPLRLAPGQAEIEVSGQVTGRQTLVYGFDAAVGQEVTVQLNHPGQASLYHNVIAPSGAMVFNGSMEGNRFQASVHERGRYQVHVYLMRNDARRGKRTAFTLRIRQSGSQAQRPGTGQAGGPSFDCRRASGVVEIAVCRSPVLAELDARLAFVYRDALAGAPASRAEQIRRDQRQWIAARESCTREPAIERCLNRRYLTRIGQLEPKR